VIVADLESISSSNNVSAFSLGLKSYIETGASHNIIDQFAALPIGAVSDYENIATGLSPSVSGMVNLGSRLLSNNSSSIVSQRLLKPRTDKKQSVWVQTLGGKMDYDKSDNVEGFDGNASGLLVGYDQQLDFFSAGIAIGWGETHLTNKRAVQDKSDIRSSHLTVYTGYSNDIWSTQLSANATILDYNFTRNSVVDNETRITGKSTGDLYGLDLSIGLNEVHFADVSFKPMLSLEYTRLAVDSYQEKGGLDLAVSYDTSESLRSDIHIQGQVNNITRGAWKFTPMINAGWSHDFLNDSEQLTASISNQSFSQTGATHAKNNYHLGVSLLAENINGVNIDLEYSGLINNNGYKPTASVKFQYNF
jgi:outer membrane autotransporter protein